MPADGGAFYGPVSVAADTGAVRAVLRQLRCRLCRLGSTCEELDTVEIVTAEVFNNIAEHAFGEDEGGTFDFRVLRTARGLSFEVRDRGAPMPDGEAPFGQRPIYGAVHTTPEGGFGWFLIRELAKDVRYERVDGENRLSFRIAITLPA